MKIWLKACPRCIQGLVVFERDIYGHHILCLQCGYMRDVNDEREAVSVITGVEHSTGVLPETAQPPRRSGMVR